MSVQTRNISILCGLALLLTVAPEPAGAGELNLFEWSAVAPVIVEGRQVGAESHYKVVRVSRVLRGDVEPGTEVLVRVKRANRERNLDVDPRPLRFEEERDYLLLLEPSGLAKNSGRTIFDLVRGVRGARLLPPEGAPVILDALREFIAIHERHDEQAIWLRFAEMLEGGNPVLIEAVLDQYVKFRRGDPELTLTLEPLLHHPVPAIRERTSALLDQVVRAHGREALPDETGLRTALVATARRDPEPEVRAAACLALEGFDDLAAETVLEEVADSDPDQMVRYVAEKLLYVRQRADPDRKR